MKSRLNIYHPATLLALFTLMTVSALRLAADNNPLEGYKFVHTRGLIDTWPDMVKANKTDRKWNDYKDWCNWDNWEPDGKWTKSTGDAKVEMPSFEWIRINASDATKAKYGDAFHSSSATEVRQRTHTQYHQMYCIPDSEIYLYPYSEFGQRMLNAYCDSITRWYDYETDLKSDNLKFIGDYKTIEMPFGHLGGNQPQKFLKGEIVTISSIDDYINFVQRVNGGESSLNAVLSHDLLFAEVEVNSNGDTIYIPFKNIEPIGTYSHPFSGTFDGNGHVIKYLQIECKEYWAGDTAYDKSGFIGMFGKVNGNVVIRNLHLDRNCSFKGRRFVGFVGGSNDKPEDQIIIENIWFEGEVYGKDYFGGIIGGCENWENDGAKHGNVTIQNTLMAGNVLPNPLLQQTQNPNNYSYYGAFIGFAKNTSSGTKPANILHCLNTNENFNYLGSDWSALFTSSFNTKTDDRCASTRPKDGNGNYIAFDSDAMRDALGSRNWIFDKENYPNWPIPTIKSVSHLPGAVAQFKYDYNDKEEAGVLPDKFIALDISQTFDNYVNIDQEKETFTEPMIAFRHIFKVSDGRTLADKYSKTADDNYNYIRANRRAVSALASQPFQIRLDFPIPFTGTKDGKKYYSNSNQYYCKGKNGDKYTYSRYQNCLIETFQLIDSNSETLYREDDKGDYVKDEEGKYVYDKWAATDTSGAKRYSIGKKIDGDMFKAKEDYDAYDGLFYRMIACEAPKAKGVYQVKVYAADNDNKTIKIIDTDSPLQVAEFLVTFLSDKEASFMPEKEYDLLKEGDEKYTHTENYYESTKEREPIIINFDEYARLQELDSKKGYVDNDYIKTSTPIAIYPKPEKFNEGKFYKKIIGYDSNKNPLYEQVVVGTDEQGNKIYKDKIYNTNGSEGSSLFDVDYYVIDGSTIKEPTSGQPLLSQYFKWPVSWEHSNYGFGYADRMEYNMYTLANHSLATIYKGATLAVSDFSTVQFKLVDKDGNLLDKDGNVITDDTDEDGDADSEEGSNGDEDDDTSSDGVTIVLYKETAKNRKDLYRRDEGLGGDGLYDRLYYNTCKTGSPQQGYFFYVNAASDPGVIRDINISEEPCEGTLLHVSAWVAEFSRAEETANLIFNFQAVMDEEGLNVVTLHSFVTGYVPDNQCGNWMHVYYSFVYNSAVINGKKPHHYQLTLENNAKNSHGADYAVDDIRIYMTHPNVTARQTTTFCEGSNLPADVEVGIDFETLLASAGVDFAALRPDRQLAVYYSFIDKEKYTQYLLGNEGMSLDQTFLRYKYDEDSSEDAYCGKLIVHTRFESNPDSNQGYWGANRKKFIFPTKPQDNHMAVGKEYYVVLYIPEAEESDTESQASDNEMPDFSDFYFNPNNKNDCSKYGLFTVEPSAVVNINGVAMASANDVYLCPNQKPTITVSMQDPTDPDKIQKKVPVDWYNGSLDDYERETTEERQTVDSEDRTAPLSEALKRFHIVFQLPEQLEDIAKIEVKDYPINGETSGILTKEMVKLIKDLVSGNILRLSKVEYPFGIKAEPMDFNFVIIPIDEQGVTEDNLEFNVCMSPVQINVHYQEPSLDHGFGIADYYPEGIDVPLRIGLKQIEKVSVLNSDELTASTTHLSMPLRNVETKTEGYTYINKHQQGKKKDEYWKDKAERTYWFDVDPEICLVATNDPAFKQYALITGDADVAHMDADDNKYRISTDIRVGEVFDMEAQYSENDPTGDGGNQIHMNFYKEFQKLDTSGKIEENVPVMKFREGYEYTLSFKFSEYRADGKTEISTGEDPKLPPCGGSHEFTIKIVADYQRWISQEAPNSRNWNNDANWRRVESSELMLEKDWKNRDKDKQEEFVSDGNNDRKTSFAPLDFTKVIIPGLRYDSGDVTLAPVVPELYEVVADSLNLYKGSARFRIIHYYDRPNPIETNIGSYTGSERVEFDMAAKYCYETNAAGERYLSSVQCVPWYMNTCEQIHFKPDAEIGNQRLLNYEKAWVDVELEHDKWYTLASPLQEVIAGDWYAPSNNARQESELFKGIYFGKEEENGVLVQKSNLNHRFKPAVYQRAWNKATTKIYEFGKDNVYDDNEEWVFENGIDQIVKNEWSHVYNDVTVDNGQAGIGFSIKADATETEVWDAMSDEQKKGYKTLFRLPKDDENYLYYQHGFGDNSAEDTGSGHYTPIGVREQRHKLQQYEVGSETKIITTVTGAAMEDSKAPEYFLVGNPFMAHLDMKTFLEKNSEMIEQKYWILDGKSQKAAVMTGHGLITSDENWQGDYIAPMQGFFVQKKKAYSEGTQERTDENTLTVVFDEKWTAVNVDLDMPSRLKAKTRGGDADALRISAIADGVEESQTLLMIEDEADAAFRSGEDVEMFDDDTQRDAARVFTFAGNMASLINRLPELTMTELALLAPEGKDVTLRFDGVDALGEAYLYDAREHSLTSIFDGMEYMVSGDVKSRLFITSGMELTDMTAAISISALGNEVTVIAPDNSEGLAVTVSDMGARLVFNERTPDNGMSFSLPRGIYAVRAVSGDIVKTEKILIR